MKPSFGLFLALVLVSSIPADAAKKAASQRSGLASSKCHRFGSFDGLTALEQVLIAYAETDSHTATRISEYEMQIAGAGEDVVHELGKAERIRLGKRLYLLKRWDIQEKISDKIHSMKREWITTEEREYLKIALELIFIEGSWSGELYGESKQRLIHAREELGIRRKYGSYSLYYLVRYLNNSTGYPVMKQIFESVGKRHPRENDFERNRRLNASFFGQGMPSGRR